MATLFSKCPTCSHRAQVRVVQAIGFGNALVWSEATKCENCGYAIEADDTGFPPPHYRNTILDNEGAWSILITRKADRVPFAKVIRKELSLSLGDAMAMSRAIPGIAWSGTECEVDWIRNALEASGIESQKKKCAETPCSTLYSPPDPLP